MNASIWLMAGPILPSFRSAAASVELVEQGVALALIFGRQWFSRQGSRRRGGTFVLRLTEEIRSIREIDPLKTSLRAKTVEVDVVTATIP